MNKPPLGLLPRHFWLKDRVMDCIEALNKIADFEDWDKFKEQAAYFADELTYAVKEWDKYYE